MPYNAKMFQQIHDAVERRLWLIRVTKMERECGIDPWYAEFSEWYRSIVDENYQPYSYAGLGLIVKRGRK